MSGYRNEQKRIYVTIVSSHVDYDQKHCGKWGPKNTLQLSANLDNFFRFKDPGLGVAEIISGIMTQYFDYAVHLTGIQKGGDVVLRAILASQEPLTR
jgi:hypothetical protein